MTCQNCVAKVQQLISSIEGVAAVKVTLNKPQAEVHSNGLIPLGLLQKKLGHFLIAPVLSENTSAAMDLPRKTINTYKPLILIVLFISSVTLLVQYPFNQFSFALWMRHFMASFFIVFSFFKLLNISGFAKSYAMYDLLAAKWPTWGYIYPFVELALGVAYLINFNSTITNLTTILILGFGSLGVIKSNMSKRKIKCACLGDVFDLPMSVVTIIENVTMVVMAALMLWLMR